MYTLPAIYANPTYKDIDITKVMKFVVSKSTNNDQLSFMETFTFPKIEEIRESLVQSGKYTAAQTTEILEGLDSLPEYNRD